MLSCVETEYLTVGSLPNATQINRRLTVSFSADELKVNRRILPALRILSVIRSRREHVTCIYSSCAIGWASMRMVRPSRMESSIAEHLRSTCSLELHLASSCRTWANTENFANHSVNMGIWYRLLFYGMPNKLLVVWNEHISQPVTSAAARRTHYGWSRPAQP